MYNRYSSLQEEDNYKEINCYSINSIKQLKKLKYAKENIILPYQMKIEKK